MALDVDVGLILIAQNCREEATLDCVRGRVLGSRLVMDYYCFWTIPQSTRISPRRVVKPA